MSLELPLTPSAAPPRERADARRNRERILAAADRLFAQRGVDCVSMDDVAQEAGVGKGTLYRRFADRGALVRAMVGDYETGLQDALIRGEPPLGPGAPVADRLHAFGDAILDLLERYGHLIFEAEAKAGSRYTSAPYQFYRTHVGLLLREAIGDAPRVDYLADSLLACLSAETFLHQRRGRGLALEDVRAGWHGLADAVLARSPQVSGA